MTTTPAAPPAALAAEAQALLGRLVGDPTAQFRDGQLESVAALVEGGERVLVVQRTGWGKSAVYFVATALVRARGGGPTLIVSPLLALMRDQVDAARRAGLRAVTMNSANADEWAEVTAGAGRRRGRPAAGEPRAAQQPAVPRRAAAPAGRGHRAAGRRRGALHQRLGPRLPARLPADPRPARRPPAGPPGARHHRHRQRAGGGRRGRAAGRRWRAGAHRPRHAGPREPAARRAVAADRRRPARLAGRPARRAARQRHRLRPDGLGRGGHRRAAARGRPRGPRLHRPHRPGATGSSSSAPCATTRSRRWWPPARWAWASTSPTSASSCTSARRRRRSPTTSRWAGPAGPPSAPTCCCCPASEDREIWRYFATASMPRRPDADAVLDRAGRVDQADVDRRAGDGRRRPAHPARAAAQGARRRGRRTPGQRRLVVDRRGLDLRRASATPGWPRPATPRLPSMLDYSGTDGCRMRVPAGGARTTPAPPTAVAATGAPVPGTTPTVARRRGPGGHPHAAQGRRAGRAAVAVAERHVPARGRACPAGSAPTSRSSRAARSPGSPTSAGGSGCAQLLAEQAPDAPADDRLLAACVEVLAGWGWDAAPGRGGGDAVAAATAAGGLGREPPGPAGPAGGPRRARR